VLQSTVVVPRSRSSPQKRMTECCYQNAEQGRVVLQWMREDGKVEGKKKARRRSRGGGQGGTLGEWRDGVDRRRAKYYVHE